MKILKKAILKLSKIPLFSLSTKRYLEILFEIRMDEKLNLENPQTYNEKIQWLKLYDHNPIYHCMVDKYYFKKMMGKMIMIAIELPISFANIASVNSCIKLLF